MHHVFIIVDKTKLLRIEKNVEPKDPIERLKVRLAGTLEVQVAAVRDLKQIALSVGVERTLAELFPLLNTYYEYDGEDLLGMEQHHAYKPCEAVFEETANQLDIEFI
eukprot:360058_1